MYEVKPNLHISQGALSELIVDLPPITLFVSDRDLVIELFPFKGLWI
jgi:hypothetical protein